MPVTFNTDALRRAIGQLPAQLTNNVARGAARAFAAPIIADAKRRCRDEEVGESLKVTTRVEPGAVVATIGTSGKGAYRAPWAENGTRPHLIAVNDQDRKGRSIGRINRLVREGSLKIGSAFVGPVVDHPGARPYPFLRPAIDSETDAGMEAATAYVAKRLAAGDLSTPAPPDNPQP
jgi:hypothetical protein